MKHTPLLALLALAACTSFPAAPATAGTPTAALNKTAYVGFWSIKPIAVLEDSRCPKSVQCVWAGQVRIRAKVMSRGRREVRELTLAQPITVAGGTLTLVDVQPPRLRPGPIDPRHYRFTFRFTR